MDFQVVISDVERPGTVEAEAMITMLVVEVVPMAEQEVWVAWAGLALVERTRAGVGQLRRSPRSWADFSWVVEVVVATRTTRSPV